MPLRRADRLFNIICILLAASQPVTAAAFADELDVTVPTVYRDVATLQARRIAIAGSAGVEYVLRRRVRAAATDVYRGRGRGHRGRGAPARPHRCPGLQKAAESVLSKMTLVVPDPLCDY